jgi:hypothetical protein
MQWIRLPVDSSSFALSVAPMEFIPPTQSVVADWMEGTRGRVPTTDRGRPPWTGKKETVTHTRSLSLAAAVSIGGN